MISSSTSKWRLSAVLLTALTLPTLLLQPNGSRAQGRVDAYITSTFAGTVSSISGSGIALGYDDDGAYGFSAPFAFNYDGNTISAGTTLYVMDNGMVGIGASANGGYGTTTTGVSSYPNILSICNSDLIHFSTNNYWQVTGTSPNRVLTMEEYNVSAYYNSATAVTLQTKIYETTSVIEFWYSSYGYSIAGSDGCQCVTIGLNGGTTGGFKSNVYQAGGTTTPASNIRFTPPPPPIIAELALLPQPKVLNFGTLLAGQSAQQTVTIKNVGPNGTLTFNSINVSGNPDFTIFGPLPSPILPGNSGTITIQFSPLAAGNRSASLNIITNGRDSGSQSVQLSGTGIAPALLNPTTQLFRRTKTSLGHSLTQSFVVTSNGTGPLTFTGFTIVGQYAGEYAVTRTPQNPLPSGSSDTVSVTYSPTIEGSRPATLIITDNSLNLPRDTVQLYGIGILPRLVVTPNPLNFDSVGVGQNVCLPITLYNPGTDTVQITKNYFSSNDVDYTLTPLTGTDTAIAPDKSKQVMVCFTPVRNGSRQARFRVTTSIPLTFDSPRRDTGSFTVNIIGIGVPYGHLAVGGSAIVDSTIIGQQICRTDTFYNTGTADLTLTSGTITGANATEYTLSGVTFPIVIPAGGSQVFTICATPAQRGDRNANLVLTGSTNSNPINANLPIDVYGQLACASASPQNAFTAKTCVGSTDSAIVTVSNCGDVQTTYTAALSTGATAYSIGGATTSPVTGPGANATFTVYFTPTTGGTQNATLTVTGTGNVTQTVNLTGTASTSTIAGADSAQPTRMHETSQFTVKLNNSGDCDWVPGTPTSSDAQFVYVSGGATNIPAKGSGTLTFSFIPNKQFEQIATLSFPSATGLSSPPPSVTVNGYGLPVLGVAHQTEAGGYSLMQNYPNPFNPTTEIRFVLPKDANVRLDILDVTGKMVRTVLNERMTAGDHGTVVDASELASGTYYYRLTSGSVVLTRQMVLTK